MGFIANCFKKIDYFGLPIRLTFKESNFYQTSVGGCLTLI